MRYTSLKFISILFLSVSAFISGCRKEKDTDAGGTATQAMAGEFWVQISVEDELLLNDYFKVITYNTADNVDNKMWIDDQEHIWPFKFKMDVNPSAQTFTANAVESQYTPITVTLTNGKILSNVTKGPASQVPTDSIYFEAEFSDDPGTVYQFSGYRRTKWPEDDHE
jgi:hypothetical protein